MSRRRPTPVNIRNFSVKCGRCGEYPALSAYEPGEEWNTYRFECEGVEDGPGDADTCAPILLEIPVEIDEFANRDATWGGGKKHAGADAGRSEPDSEPDTEPAEATEGGGAGAARGGGLLPVVSD